MYSMKGKLILLASVLFNLLVMCTYGDSASSGRVYQLKHNFTHTVHDNNSTGVTATSSTTTLSPSSSSSITGNSETSTLLSVKYLHLNAHSPEASDHVNVRKDETITSPLRGDVSVPNLGRGDSQVEITTKPMLRETNDSGILDTVNTWPQYLSGDSDLNEATTESSLFLAHDIQASSTDANHDPMDNGDLFQGDISGIDPESKTAVRIFNLWPLGIVPYTMDLTLLPIRDRIKSAMTEIESKTCVRFMPRLLSRDYVNMGSGSGCYSNIGRQGGGQVLSLGRGCHAHNTILHELLHAVGFEHMHSHRDRDMHLRILWQNIPRDKWRQFEVVSLLGYKAIIPFDYESVMLYGPKTFGEDGKITMESKAPNKRVMEMNEKPGLSQGDIDGINRLYYCRRSTSGQWVHVTSRK